MFINIGRGDVITEEDLIKALDSDWISAAILDVFVPEPLPSNSRLWLHPKVGSINLFCRLLTKFENYSYQTQSTDVLLKCYNLPQEVTDAHSTV